MQTKESSNYPRPSDFLCLSHKGAKSFLEPAKDKETQLVVEQLLISQQPLSIKQFILELKAEILAPISLLSKLYKKGFFDISPDASTLFRPHRKYDLEDYLPELSTSSHALLADAQGFLLGLSGFSQQAAIEISGFAAETFALQTRRQYLTKHLNNKQPLVFSTGNHTKNEQLNFYPLYFSKHTLILVIQGQPCFSNDTFINFIQFMGQRFYSNKPRSHYA